MGGPAPDELLAKCYAREHTLTQGCWEPFALLWVYYCYRKGKGVTTCEDKLIERAAHGDQEAFRYLWEAHHAAMAAALRLCHQRALAEEITQGAFLRVSESRYTERIRR